MHESTYALLLRLLRTGNKTTYQTFMLLLCWTSYDRRSSVSWLSGNYLSSSRVMIVLLNNSLWICSPHTHYFPHRSLIFSSFDRTYGEALLLEFPTAGYFPFSLLGIMASIWPFRLCFKQAQFVALLAIRRSNYVIPKEFMEGIRRWIIHLRHLNLLLQYTFACSSSHSPVFALI